MDDHKLKGAELSQLARLLFDEAANKWYTSVGLEMLAGFAAALFSLWKLSGDLELFSALLCTFFIIVAYVLRLQFDDQYDAAETMRRQSTLTEALGWSVSKTQMSLWRHKAGKRIRSKLKHHPRESDYYSTNQEIGPKRLAEMTTESAFFTRLLYIKLRWLVWLLFTISIVLLILVMTVALSSGIPAAIDLALAKVLFAIIPVLISIDLLGWGLRLNKLIYEISTIENELEKLIEEEPNLHQVLRLVSEYNCQVVKGLPILKWMFKHWHDEIKELWIER